MRNDKVLKDSVIITIINIFHCIINAGSNSSCTVLVSNVAIFDS